MQHQHTSTVRARAPDQHRQRTSVIGQSMKKGQSRASVIEISKIASRSRTALGTRQQHSKRAQALAPAYAWGTP